MITPTIYVVGGGIATLYLNSCGVLATRHSIVVEGYAFAAIQASALRHFCIVLRNFAREAEPQPTITLVG